jgi:hypothetical protein
MPKIFTELEMSSSYEQRKLLFDNLKILTKPEYEEVFKIIYKNKESYTENSNGIFFDLLNIAEDTVYQLKNYIEFCLKTRMDEEFRLKELETIRIQNENYVDEDDYNDNDNNINTHLNEVNHNK